MGKLKEDKRYINKVCLYQNSLGLNSLSLVIRMFFFSWYRKDFFHMGVFSLAFSCFSCYVCIYVCVATSLMEGENGWILKLSTDMNCFKLTLLKAFVPMVLCLIDWSLMPIVRASWF